MDHGDPRWPHGDVMFCSDEHVTLKPNDADRWSVGDRVRLAPAHIDPTIAYHPTLYVLQGDQVVDEWPVDLRGW